MADRVTVGLEDSAPPYKCPGQLLRRIAAALNLSVRVSFEPLSDPNPHHAA